MEEKETTQRRHAINLNGKNDTDVSFTVFPRSVSTSLLHDRSSTTDEHETSVFHLDTL